MQPAIAHNLSGCKTIRLSIPKSIGSFERIVLCSLSLLEDEQGEIWANASDIAATLGSDTEDEMIALRLARRIRKALFNLEEAGAITALDRRGNRGQRRFALTPPATPPPASELLPPPVASPVPASQPPSPASPASSLLDNTDPSSLDRTTLPSPASESREGREGRWKSFWEGLSEDPTRISEGKRRWLGVLQSVFLPEDLAPLAAKRAEIKRLILFALACSFKGTPERIVFVRDSRVFVASNAPPSPPQEKEASASASVTPASPSEPSAAPASPEVVRAAFANFLQELDKPTPKAKPDPKSDPKSDNIIPYTPKGRWNPATDPALQGYTPRPRPVGGV